MTSNYFQFACRTESSTTRRGVAKGAVCVYSGKGGGWCLVIIGKIEVGTDQWVGILLENNFKKQNSLQIVDMIVTI